MSLPSSPETCVPRREQWKVWGIHKDRTDDGNGVEYVVRDRLFRDRRPTSEYRERRLTKHQVARLRGAKQKRTYMQFEDHVHTEAK